MVTLPDPLPVEDSRDAAADEGRARLSLPDGASSALFPLTRHGRSKKGQSVKHGVEEGRGGCRVRCGVLKGIHIALGITEACWQGLTRSATSGRCRDLCWPLRPNL